MAERRVVVLYGKSLFVAGVETFLKNRAELDVVRIDFDLPNIEICLKALCPDAIVFDSGDAILSTLPGITQLLKACPDALAISLDLDASNEVIVFFSRRYPVTKAENLVEAIQMGIHRD